MKKFTLILTILVVFSLVSLPSVAAWGFPRWSRLDPNEYTISLNIAVQYQDDYGSHQVLVTVDGTIRNVGLFRRHGVYVYIYAFVPTGSFRNPTFGSESVFNLPPTYLGPACYFISLGFFNRDYGYEQHYLYETFGADFNGNYDVYTGELLIKGTRLDKLNVGENTTIWVFMVSGSRHLGSFFNGEDYEVVLSANHNHTWTSSVGYVIKTGDRQFGLGLNWTPSGGETGVITFEKSWFSLQSFGTITLLPKAQLVAAGTLEY